MHSAKDSNPEVCKIFSEGNFAIQCRDRKWAGLAHIDLLIVQVIMRSLKINGDRYDIASFYSHKFNFYIKNARTK